MTTPFPYTRGLDQFVLAVAHGLKRVKPTSAEEGYPQWASTVISISHELSGQFPGFPVTDFLNAAGLGAFQD